MSLITKGLVSKNIITNGLGSLTVIVVQAWKNAIRFTVFITRKLRSNVEI